uniref:Serpin domain-containing protein n=1 Tax=Naja naja TaxID=35670 RepID=A0A8C6Y6K7_NAJNA
MSVLQLPFEGEELLFLSLVPDDNTSIDEIIMNLTYEKLQEWISEENMKSVQTKISMPKFTLENQYPLKAIFSAMGVNDLFIPGKANLSGMTGNNQFLVSQINQGITFTISEEGAAAAGASRTEVVSGSHPEIKIDKPFLFVVKHKPSNLILLWVGFVPSLKVHPK